MTFGGITVFRITTTLVVVLALASCSSYMAASGERKRDLDLLSPGTSRDVILAEFGSPMATIDEIEAETPQRYDIFSFVQGRSSGSNAGRAVFYGAAAVLTLGLSEVIATPLEGAVGDVGEIKLRTNYNQDWRLINALILDEGRWVSMEQFAANAQARRDAAAEAAKGKPTN